MGGIGSSRWDGHARRRRIGEGTLELPVSALLELAKAPAGTVAGFAWGELLKLQATIEEKRGPLGNTLTARRVIVSDLEGVQLGAVMLLGYRAPFGGVRWWLACPECGQRRRALYSVHTVRWRCRKCSGLAYHSQRLAPLDRLQHRGCKIARRMGHGATWYPNNTGSPPKPKGMHWSTWERHNRELDTVEARRNAAWMQAVAPFLARADKYNRRQR
jgi:hypothetical protein